MRLTVPPSVMPLTTLSRVCAPVARFSVPLSVTPSSRLVLLLMALNSPPLLVLIVPPAIVLLLCSTTPPFSALICPALLSTLLLRTSTLAAPVAWAMPWFVRPAARLTLMLIVPALSHHRRRYPARFHPRKS